jgi:ACS family hexuronate transporter-like MFS transporter
VLWLAIYQRPAKSKWLSPAELEYIEADPSLPEVAPAESVPGAVPGAVPVTAPAGGTRWIDLLGYQQTWAFCLQSICVQPIWWFYLYWLPKFFTARYGLTISKSGKLLAITYSMSLVGSVGGGVLPAWFLRRGWTLNLSRKITLLGCVLLALPMVLVSKIDNMWIATVLIGCALAAMQAWSANTYTMVSDLFPKRAVASIVGLGSALGSVAAMALAEIVGSVLEKTGSYRIPFLIADLSLPLAWSMIQLLAPRWEAARIDELPLE